MFQSRRFILVALVTLGLITFFITITGCSKSQEDFLAQLSSPEKEKRIEAIIALGQTQDKSALKPLTDALGDTDAEIREEAMRALKRFGSDAIPALSVAVNEVDKNKAYCAFSVLASIADVKVIDPLISAINRNREPQLLKTMAESMKEIGPAALDILHSVAQSEEVFEKRRAGVIDVIMYIKDESSISVIQDIALRSNNSNVRIHAARALNTYGEKGYGYIIEIANNYDKIASYNERLVAIQALTFIDDIRVGDILIALQNSDVSGISEAAKTATIKRNSLQKRRLGDVDSTSKSNSGNTNRISDKSFEMHGENSNNKFTSIREIELVVKNVNNNIQPYVVFKSGYNQFFKPDISALDENDLVYVFTIYYYDESTKKFSILKTVEQKLQESMFNEIGTYKFSYSMDKEMLHAAKFEPICIEKAEQTKHAFTDEDALLVEAMIKESRISASLQVMNLHK